MAHYPINLNLKDRKCIVVGGGCIAERKAGALCEFGAAVSIVAPELTAGLRQMVDSQIVTYIDDVFRADMLDGVFVAIAATDDREVNRAVYLESEKRGILVNVVDDPELCSFYTPAVIQRGNLIISISTSGESPTLARKIREELELQFGDEYGQLSKLLGDLRGEVKSRYSQMGERSEAYCRIVESDALELLGQGQYEEAVRRAKQCI
ncbi:MAG: precorrin-2 dehydrogenase/sirohydrochlorin ferrochelatase family protein [Armatimonadota bacterium]